MAIAIALLGFNDLGRSVTPNFLSRNRFYIQLSPQCPKMNKNQWGKLKFFSRFLSTGHQILPSCGWKARKTKVIKCELVLWGTSPVFQIHLIGPLEQCLAENISLQRSNCNIFGLTDTVALIANEARFFRLRVFFRACYLQNEVGDPYLFYIAEITNSLSYSDKSLRKKLTLENFRANVLKRKAWVALWTFFVFVKQVCRGIYPLRVTGVAGLRNKRYMIPFW